MSVSHENDRFADPDYDPCPVPTEDEYDGPDYQGEVLAEERREEALKSEVEAILKMIPSRVMTTAKYAEACAMTNPAMPREPEER